MMDKLALIWPEVALFLTTCVVMVVGLSPSVAVRRLCAWISGLGLLVAGGLAASSPTGAGLFPGLAAFAKPAVALVGLVLLTLVAGVVDRDIEDAVAAGKAKFSPLRATRAEFYAFFLFSLTGLMLCASADDLIWLFLALELTSLPTYIMVTISTRGTRSQEAGVKYFFLGALGAAVFLYGFALLYGAAGTTSLVGIAEHFQAGIADGTGIGLIGTAGLLIALIGVSFKIAAVPMHFYTPDVYQGAASPVSAFLAFVPKTAGFIAIMLLCGTVGWGVPGITGEQSGLPPMVESMLWIVAALTMTVGNVLAILQTSVKRMLAYSSIAHSGYMLVGIIAGPGALGAVGFTESGIAAVLFYLVSYGVMNTGVFAVLACLERDDGSEPDSFDDIRGLVRTHPVLGWTVIICTLSLLGFPPLLGFWTKLGLFTAAISNGHLPLVILLGINSAIAAVYYLRLVATVYLEPKDAASESYKAVPFVSRPVGAVVAGLAVLVLLFAAGALTERSAEAAAFVTPAEAMANHPRPEAAPTGVALRDE